MHEIEATTLVAQNLFNFAASLEATIYRWDEGFQAHVEPWVKTKAMQCLGLFVWAIAHTTIWTKNFIVGYLADVPEVQAVEIIDQSDSVVYAPPGALATVKDDEEVVLLLPDAITPITTVSNQIKFQRFVNNSIKEFQNEDSFQVGCSGLGSDCSEGNSMVLELVQEAAPPKTKEPCSRSKSAANAASGNGTKDVDKSSTQARVPSARSRTPKQRLKKDADA